MTTPELPARRNGSVSFEEAQQIARKHAKAEPESYYSEPFEPHLWVINAIIEASATWYDRAVEERIRRVAADRAASEATANIAQRGETLCRVDTCEKPLCTQTKHCYWDHYEAKAQLCFLRGMESRRPDAMKSLPYDIARCSGTPNLICMQCRRREPGSPERQVYIAPAIHYGRGGVTCPNRIEPVKGANE